MAPTIEKIVNVEHFPIFHSGDDGYQSLVSDISNQLEANGCAVLKGFIRPEFQYLLSEESARVAQRAYGKVEAVNVYNTDVTAEYPADHPGRIIMQKGNAFVARDQIGKDAVIARLYENCDFKSFIGQCFNLDQVYELGDPYSGLCVNVLRPGFEHPWHFDINEYTVSMLTQLPSGGGVFEYCPNIRTPKSENMPAVLDVMTGGEDVRIERLRLQPGDLQLFKGRYAMHRVTKIIGDQQRHTAIFAYSEVPGVIATPERSRQLFGRVAPEHLRAEAGNARTDNLMD